MTAAGRTLATASSPSFAIGTRVARPVIGGALLLLAFAAALWAPIPTLPDAGRHALLSRLEQRLPGWQVERLAPSWEGASTVVTSCAGHEIGFQLVPGHGLAPGSVWLVPDDPTSRRRLARISDEWRELVWHPEDARADALTCDEMLARFGPSRD